MADVGAKSRRYHIQLDAQYSMLPGSFSFAALFRLYVVVGEKIKGCPL
jgi:hypothetical protein